MPNRPPPCDVLIVEDDPDARERIRRCLRDEGHRVAVAATHRQALDALAHARFDLVVLDAAATEPEDDRRASAARVRELVGYTPIVLYAAPRDGDLDALRERGFHDPVLYPFDLDELCAAVRRALSPRR